GFAGPVPRVSQVDVRVEEPGGDGPAPHVPHDGAIRRPEPGADGGDFAVLDEHVHGLVERPARVDHTAALQQERPHHSFAPPAGPFAASASSGRPPASRYSAAMRTATPLVTWARMTLCDPSATRESLSAPRLM